MPSLAYPLLLGGTLVIALVTLIPESRLGSWTVQKCRAPKAGVELDVTWGPSGARPALTSLAITVTAQLPIADGARTPHHVQSSPSMPRCPSLARPMPRCSRARTSPPASRATERPR